MAMAVDAVLLESPTMRARVAHQLGALERVRWLQVLPDGVHVTTEGVAAYFEVPTATIRSVVLDHREELLANGYRVISGGQLNSFEELCRIRSRARSLALFTRRTVLTTATLLRESEIARRVRCELMGANDPVGPHAADDRWGAAAQSLDAVAARAAENASGTVLPLLTAVADEAARMSRKVDSLFEQVDRLERCLLDEDQRAMARGRLRLLRAIDEGVGEELLDDLD
jgi:hypothetical protein